MGEYYNWVNVDKKEYICPNDFGYGNKRTESCARSNEVLKALYSLLSSEWKGGRIFWMGDEISLPEESNLELFSILKVECEALGYGKCNLFDTVYETYRNVSALFKKADKTVKEEIGYYIEDLRRGENDLVNEYGVDPLNPYAGLFQKESRDFQYVINVTKKVGYSFESTKILYMDGSESDYADPLPVLLGYGNYHKQGEWIGDIIDVANELPKGITLLKEISLDW